MNIEISLTRALANKLNLKLERSKNIKEESNHYYADIITKNHQQVIIFFNTLFGWSCLIKLSQFKKDNLIGLKDAIYKFLMNEGVKPYIINNYLDDIDNINLSLTSNSSTVARMNNVKKELHSYYDAYFDVPDAITLAINEEINDTISKHPFSKNSLDYIIPYIEMGYFLFKNYSKEDVERQHHEMYFLEKEEDYKDLPVVTDLSSFSNEEIGKYSSKINPGLSFLTNYYFIKQFYKLYPNPSIEDHFEYILSRLSPKDLDVDRYVKAYMKIFNLNEDLFILYYKYFGRKYETKLTV